MTACKKQNYELHNELYVMILILNTLNTLHCDAIYLYTIYYMLYLVVHIRLIDKIYSPTEQSMREGMGPGLEKREYLEPEAELVSVVFCVL